MSLLSPGYTNAKLKKSVAESYILYMAPAALNSKQINLCPGSTAGCRKSCLYTAGRGAMSSVQVARLRKADYFVNDQTGFIAELHGELLKLNAKGNKIAVRLNGTTDIDWENLINMEQYTNIQFYDYTKRIDRAMRFGGGVNWPSNYHLTYSRSETSKESHLLKLLALGVNIAVVFADSLPNTYLGYKVVSGDETDERWLDQACIVIGLVAKGKAKKDTSRFVVQSLNTIQKAG